MEEGKLGPSKAESNAIASASGQSSLLEPQKKKKKGPKGPNPLSVKKKKPKEDGRKPRARDPEQPPMVGEKQKRMEDGEGDLSPEAQLEELKKCVERFRPQVEQNLWARRVLESLG